MLDLDNTIKAIPLSQPLPELDITTIEISKNQSNKLCFIDGGNSELISSPHLVLQVIKTAAVYIINNKISNIDVHKYITLIQTKKQSFQISEPNTPTFTIKTNKDIHETANIIRNLKELQLYQKLLDTTDSILIKDGTFESQTNEEKNIINQLKYLCGLAKTSEDIHNNISTLTSINQQSDPCYTKLNSYYYTKLNKFSNYTFKLEIKNLELNETLKQLASNSKDYIYPGYPYGLILADKFARISKQQTESLKTYIQAKTKKDWKTIQSWENTINAHQILDKLSF